jgi:GH24 family phage-related lysozyme (muramidase)
VDRNKLYYNLVRDEGERLTAYRDSEGRWTIGIGHLLDMDPSIPEPRIKWINKEESRALFDYDVQWAIDLVHELFPQTEWVTWNNSQDVRMRALVNMAFNRGEKRMRESTTITPAILHALQDTAIPSPRWAEVGKAIRASEWATKIRARALRLAYMLETGMDS